MDLRPDPLVTPPVSQRSRSASRGAARIASLLLALGGGLLGAASLLELGSATGAGYTETIPAVETFEGGAFAAAGVAFVVAALVVWGPAVGRPARTAGLGAVLGGGAVLWLATTAALAVGREGGRLGEGVEVGLGAGLYLAFAGGILALIGGATALLAPRDREARGLARAPEPRRAPPPVPARPPDGADEPGEVRWDDVPPPAGDREET